MKVEIVSSESQKRIPKEGEYWKFSDSKTGVFRRLTDEDAKTIAKGWTFDCDLTKNFVSIDVHNGRIVHSSMSSKYDILIPIGIMTFNVAN
jgi:hypothetical protein